MPHQCQEISVSLNQNGLIASLKDMAHASVTPVAAPGVDTVHLAHALGQIAHLRLDHQMIVVGHPTVGIAHPLHPPADLPEHVEECLSTLIAQGDIRPVIATGGDMVQSTRKLYAQWSSHGDQ